MNDAVAMLTSRAGSQATTIEQSRAVAEVQAAVVLAQSRPRVIASALTQMRTVCAMPTLAERAFFRFPRGGETVSGESVHLARELARCWGNIDYGVKELFRSDEDAISEMLAFAWDLETNCRVENTFLVPHKRDTKRGAMVLTDMRDIYENNANMAARRLRECIFSVLPIWFTDEAKDRCHYTLEKGGDIPLPQRIADMIEGFGTIAVSVSQLERKVGRKTNDMTAQDVSQLGIVFRSIRRGETRVENEFDPDQVEAKPFGDAPEKVETAVKTVKEATAAEVKPRDPAFETPADDPFAIPPALRRTSEPPKPEWMEPRTVSAANAKAWTDAFLMMICQIDPARVDEAVKLNRDTFADLRRDDLEAHDLLVKACEDRKKEGDPK